jgi:hypothetical protein
MADAKIIYEPHPISPERKAELVGQGFKIMDAIFAPEDAKPAPVADKPAAAPKAAAKKADD